MTSSEHEPESAAPESVRVNFSYAGTPPSGSEPIYDKEGLKRGRNNKLEGALVVPPGRDIPSDSEVARSFEDTISVGDSSVIVSNGEFKVTFEISNIKSYETGLRFDFVASRSESEDDGLLGDSINVSQRKRIPKIGQAVLEVSLLDGVVLSNKKSRPMDAPEPGDSSTFWLYGGEGYNGRTETWTRYFLSPLPDSGSLIEFSVSYPEIGMKSSSHARFNFDLKRARDSSEKP